MVVAVEASTRAEAADSRTAVAVATVEEAALTAVAERLPSKAVAVVTATVAAAQLS